MRPDNSNYLVTIPSYHPNSQEYKIFWSEQIRRCIVGYWSNGYYMPPALYFYANLATIKLNKGRSQAKSYARPTLRDLEWDVFSYLFEAKGFSGFLEDTEYTCCHEVLENYSLDYYSSKLPHTLFNGILKKYIHPRDYLVSPHPHFDTPLYDNQVSNFMLMGSRNLGKSYMIGAGLIAYTFLFDNRLNLTAPRASTEILVGSVVSDKSADLLNKARDCMNLLPGKYDSNNLNSPSPLSKAYVGSFALNSEVISGRRVKNTIVGSNSTIKHRSFNENSFAAQGTRPSILIVEECGLVPNLLDIHNNTVDNLRDGLRKTGSLIMLGTGGDMEKGSIPASQMFFEPDKYNILKFPNIYEESSSEIGYFIPAYLSLNEYKDENGITDVPTAKQALLDERKRLQQGSPDALNKAIQYKPFTPSEMFLSRKANIFPSAELSSSLRRLMLAPATPIEVTLFFDPTSPYQGVNYDLNPHAVPLKTFPTTSESRDGSITIYELPSLFGSHTPKDAYIIGHDPIKEDSPTGPSLATIYVMKTSAYFSSNGHHEIVASFIGRPYEGKNAINDILHKLSLFYGNATIYFEAQVGNVKDYFERIGRLDLLASQPNTIFQRKAGYNTAPSTTYGYPMSNEKIKWEAVQYLRNFLLETHHDNYLNLDVIPDPGLLQELLAFSMDKGNYDRVMGFIGCIVGLQELHNLSVRRSKVDPVINSQFNKLNSRLFSNVNKTETFF